MGRIIDGVISELPPTIPPSLLPPLPTSRTIGDDADCIGRSATIVGTDGNDNLGQKAMMSSQVLEETIQ